MKKIKILLLIIVFFITTNVSAETMDDLYESNWNSIIIADKIQTYIKNTYNINKIFEDKYPDFYGGIYISDDAKNVIIQIVKNKMPNESSFDYEVYKKMIEYDDVVKIEYVNHSFNELNTINNLVSNYISKNNNVVKGCYIDVLNNSVVIELEKLTSNNINETNKELLLGNYYKANTINYEQYIFPKEHITTLKSGQSITVSNGIGFGTCSTGFRTQYNNNNGYVTAGHCVKGSLAIQTGSVMLAQFTNNQNYDYGFVAFNSDYTMNNNLIATSTGITKLAVVNYCPTITTNMAIAKSGSATNYTSGKVKGLNQTASYISGYTIKGLVKSNVQSDDGDSGAPVFIPRTDANGGAIPIGVLSGGATGIFGLYSITYFTSINDMPSQLQSNRY